MNIEYALIVIRSASTVGGREAPGRACNTYFLEPKEPSIKHLFAYIQRAKAFATDQHINSSMNSKTLHRSNTAHRHIVHGDVCEPERISLRRLLS